MRYLLVIITNLLIASCSNNMMSKDETFSLNGQWKLVEYCMSPGDITCPKQIPTHDEYYEFSGTDIFTFHTTDVHCHGNYILTDDLIAFKSMEGACTLDERYLRVISQNRIEINPRCKEQCTFIYDRI